MRLVGRQATLVWALLLLATTAALALPEVPLAIWPALVAVALPLCGWLGLGEGFELRRRTLVVCLLLVGGLVFYRHGSAIYGAVRSQTFAWSDRWAQHAVPVFPRTYFAGRPQTVYVCWPGLERVRWKDGAELAIVKLGDDLARLTLDSPPPRLPAVLCLEGTRSTEVTLEVVPTHVEPGRLAADAGQGLACTVSEPTDQLVVAWRDGRVNLFGCDDGPSCSLVLPGGRVAVGSRFSRSIAIYDARTGKRQQRSELPGAVECLALSADGTVLAVAWEGDAPALDLLSTSDLGRLTHLDLTMPVEMMCFGRSRDELVLASRRGRALLLVRDGKLQPRVRPLARPATGLCLGADGMVYLTTTSG
ncbi:MAG: hypothetical protein KC910_36460, partial [Candidatus Eremiobacteraeota bacterium]|nr:hypothetical protein [Candidatus Eremiobacteraeota bacterium]